VLVQDTDAADELKTVTAQSIADLSGGGTPEGTAILSTGETAGKLLQADGDNSCSWVAAPSGTPEGTAILSTGETGGTKYLREDGDGTCSWQAVAGGGLSNIVEDTTPELGGELDCGAHSIGFTAQSATGDGTTTIDWGAGNVFNFQFQDTLSETFTFTAPSNPGVFVLKLSQGLGGELATWPASVKWPGGTAPTLSTGSGNVDIVRFYYDGTNYYGTYDLNFS